MQSTMIETLVKLAEQLNANELAELVRRIEALRAPRQRPSQTLRVFHVDTWPEELTLRREDEYGDDGR